ncbi:unnamed protein product, partial [Brenthis ino]
MGGKRVCEVCGINESRRGGFFGSFPLDENRCRALVMLVGKKDLVFLPIEKLHKLRSVCGDHFEKRDFNKKGNRLKKRAYPKLNLLAAPLPDEVLREFPFHVASKTAPLHSGTSKQQNATVDEHILNGSNEIPLEVKELCAVSFLATGSYQRIVGITHNLPQRTTSRCIRQVVDALNHPAIMAKWIVFPKTRQDRGCKTRVSE